MPLSFSNVAATAIQTWTSGTPINVNLPAGSGGKLAMMFWGVDTAKNLVLPAGWVKEIDTYIQTDGLTGRSTEIWTKNAEAGDGATISVDVDAGSTSTIANAFRIQGGDNLDIFNGGHYVIGTHTPSGNDFILPANSITGLNPGSAVLACWVALANRTITTLDADLVTVLDNNGTYTNLSKTENPAAGSGNAEYHNIFNDVREYGWILVEVKAAGGDDFNFLENYWW